MYVDECTPGICRPCCETKLAGGLHIIWVERKANIETDRLTIAIMEMRAWLTTRANASTRYDLCELIKGAFEC
jgi:hypothetical protein